LGGEGELRVRVLGPFEVTVFGQAVALGGAKPRALLAALVINANRVVSADVLVDVLWGDGPPGRATSTVQKYVYELRSVLDPGRAENGDRVLVTRPPGYLLTLTTDQLDAARFEQLVADGQRWAADADFRRAEACFDDALGLWRGSAWNLCVPWPWRVGPT
jgi:DNA-binding SARP family transcriptional activator